MKTHKCLAKKCTQQVNMNMLMCHYHWQMVPGDVQEKVWQTYKAPGRLGHIDAMLKAMKAVEEREKVK
jgi:hypothetical protein